MARNLLRVLLPLGIAAVSLGQYPQTSPYPPGQNPGGQYPSQYPPNNSPIRLPGGVPISVPEVKLPKRSPSDKDSKNDKNGSNSQRMTLRAVDGTLRELGEKDLFLETSNKRILKFRLLEKTQFQNKEGEAVRDSLLKAGDQLSVQVNADDPETILRVILSRAGTQAERTASARPFDHDSAKAPVSSDTHAAGTMEISTDAPAPSNRDGGDRPTLTAPGRAPEVAAEKSEPGTSANPEKAANPETSTRETKSDRRTAGSPAPSDDIISRTREVASSLTDGLPNFIVQQVTARTYSNTLPARWRTVDVVTAEVVSVDGKEEYRNIQVNGKPSSQPVEKTGAWSTGEFVTTLEDLLSIYTAANFRRGADDQIQGRKAYTYNFTVLQENSNWDIIAPTGAKASPSYSGTLWIDQETFHVLRIEERTGPMPSNFPFDKAESALEYGFVRIDSKSYVLPIHSEILTCQRDSPNCTKNEINFQNYRRFGADSKITFDK